MAKITQKTQIPQYAQKKIANFSKLTKNQAIYEYELLKLKRRAGKEFGSFLSGYYERAGRITQKTIEKISSIRGKKLTQERKSYELDRRLAKIDREDDYWLDINDEIEKEIKYRDTDDYLKETSQQLNPLTGEVVSSENYPTIIEMARKFLDELYQYTINEQNTAIISNSSYRSGRTRSSKSRQWIANNIENATTQVLNQISRIASSDEMLLQFAKEYSDDTKLQALQDAISEYIQSSYATVGNGSAFQSSKVYSMLSMSPMTLEETMEFEDEE